eukprot:COSAG04_NODE_2566_length_3917_cov_2.125196_4_plen_368_part_00
MAAAMAFQWSLAALETLMAEDQMDRHAAVLRAFSVVELWRLRRVCRAFHRWGTAALAALPRVAVAGGETVDFEWTASVEVLDLSTLRWSSGVVPALPEPRDYHPVCAFGDGRVVVAGAEEDGQEKTAMQWVPGAVHWAPLPDMAACRRLAAAVALPDGRAMVIGGYDDDNDRAIASVEVLVADGSGWSALAPMGTTRAGVAAAVLPCGKVLVAGGWGSGGGALDTAALWDPATGAWSDLPPMTQARTSAGCCVLPSGRVAVVGGEGADYQLRRDGEEFDPVARTWQPLQPMAHGRRQHGVVAVAGGLVAVGGRPEGEPAELFDEASGRWFELPHPMAQPRTRARLVTVPASALAQPAVPGAAAAANA